MWGRPVRRRLLRLWNRARRDRFCVLSNDVALRATVLAQQAWSLLAISVGATDIFNGLQHSVSELAPSGAAHCC